MISDLPHKSAPVLRFNDSDANDGRSGAPNDFRLLSKISRLFCVFMYRLDFPLSSLHPPSLQTPLTLHSSEFINSTCVHTFTTSSKTHLREGFHPKKIENDDGADDWSGVGWDWVDERVFYSIL